MNRILGGATKAVRKSWHMYPLGFLFGLGFDTATEVSLLVIAGGAAAFSLPWYAILTLPVLFAAGMSLLDSIDGCFMNFAYGWAFSKPVRKVYYNITITGLSVAVALIIGVDRAAVDPHRQAEHQLRADRLARQPRSQLRRLRDRRTVRADLGGRAGRLEIRPDRGEVVAERAAGSVLTQRRATTAAVAVIQARTRASAARSVMPVTGPRPIARIATARKTSGGTHTAAPTRARRRTAPAG